MTDVSKLRVVTLAMVRFVLKSKRLSRKGPSHGHFPDGIHVMVAVDVAQVSEIDRILGRLLGMAGKAQGRDLEAAPTGLIRQLRGQAPLRLPPTEPPPGEDQAENFPRREDS